MSRPARSHRVTKPRGGRGRKRSSCDGLLVPPRGCCGVSPQPVTAPLFRCPAPLPSPGDGFSSRTRSRHPAAPGTCRSPPLSDRAPARASRPRTPLRSARGFLRGSRRSTAGAQERRAAPSASRGLQRRTPHAGLFPQVTAGLQQPLRGHPG